MKKIYIYLLAATSIMGVSCSEDWLNLNPSTSVTTDHTLSTLEDIKVALNGVYRETSQHSYYGDNYWYYGVLPRHGCTSQRKQSIRQACYSLLYI